MAMLDTMPLSGELSDACSLGSVDMLVGDDDRADMPSSLLHDQIDADTEGWHTAPPVAQEVADLRERGGGGGWAGEGRDGGGGGGGADGLCSRAVSPTMSEPIVGYATTALLRATEESLYCHGAGGGDGDGHFSDGVGGGSGYARGGWVAHETQADALRHSAAGDEVFSERISHFCVKVDKI